MRTNGTITVYNSKLDSATRTGIWHKKVIQDANFYIDTKVSVGDKALNSANMVKVRIPTTPELCNTYLDEDSWQHETDVTDKWTLQDGDYIVQGEGPDITAVKELKRKYKILSWSDNRDCTSPHWRVGAS